MNQDAAGQTRPSAPWAHLLDGGAHWRRCFLAGRLSAPPAPAVFAPAVCISAFSIRAHHLTRMTSAAWKNPFLFEPRYPKTTAKAGPACACLFVCLLLGPCDDLTAHTVVLRAWGTQHCPLTCGSHPSQHPQWWGSALDLSKGARASRRSAQSHRERRAVTHSPA